MNLVKIIIMLTIASASFAKTSEKSRFEKLEVFNKVLYLIESQYYRKVDTEKLIQGALRGMMATLDPHSSFLDKVVFTKMQEDTKGEFGGLGIEVSQKDGVIIIITPIDDTPAFRAGLKSGDKIVEINHDPTLGITLDQAVDKMRGKENSKIVIGIVREGVSGIKDYTLKREIIKIKPVKSSIINNDIIFIRLSQFQKNSADYIAKAIKKHRKSLKKSGGPKGIVLDLRFNPGGLLDEAVNVSSLFLRDGIVVSTEGRDPKQKEIRYVKKTGFKELDLPMVVLINGASASASEIVAGALQDSRRAIIMGSQSFGKGSVQTVAKINNNNGLKLTIAQYMTPNNRKIQAIGIKPDLLLSEYEGKWIEDNRIEPKYIREKDLRGHLTSAIESPKEKKRREQQEREERIAKIKKNRRLKEKLKKKDHKKENNIYKKYNPKEDYQVLQAANYLQTFNAFKKLYNKN